MNNFKIIKSKKRRNCFLALFLLQTSRLKTFNLLMPDVKFSDIESQELKVKEKILERTQSIHSNDRNSDNQ